ncbi:hypothetical protein M407DRAFT_22720 [Tulasnella calospora MUT 4182]|uniref:Leucine-rich repeat and WD repeat-containing protein 1 n=1 Tax=Tulasnella calospora MUT 4182 TaxID=1051891 RepID=A0A0C3QBW8_9AGAM|nr:hypothetical protein M407DRAFT_22720 [Tulasnella calospora MUT 4182]
MTEALDDEYVRRTAVWIRTNEPRLAGVRAPRPNALNPLSWVTSPQAPTTLKLTRSQLSYLLTRIEGVGLNVGNLDIPIENPRPSQLLPKKDVSDAQSISSFVSNLSLSPASWWTKPTPIDVELKYLYSSFTKLPALHLTNPPARELERHALPLDAFKNLQNLTLEDVDPRTLLGWDRLSEAIRSLTIRRSGIEDVTHLIVDAVADNEDRRKRGDLAPIQWKPLSRRPSQVRSRQPSWQSSLRRITPVIPESEEDTKNPPSPQGDAPPTPPFSSSSSDHNPDLPKLSSSKWWCIRYLSLADNSLTFFPSEVVPYLTSVTHLDLSNNLLVSVPAGLGELHRLTSLNLSGNMIESVLGIYTQLGQVLTLNLGGNRIDSLCGLERLVGLQRVDLRNNRVEESAEVGRLATLPDVVEVWVGGNPLTTLEEDWRVNCFAFFSKERKNILLDGYAPGFLENGRIQAIVGTPKIEPVTVISSPQVAAVRSGGHSRVPSAAGVGSPTLNGASTPSQGSPQVTAVGGAPSTSASSPAPSYMVATIHTAPKSKRRKQPRIVHLDEDAAAAEAADTPSREMSPARLFRASPLSASPAKNPPVLSSAIPDAASDSDPFADPPEVEILNSPIMERRTSGRSYTSATFGRTPRRTSTNVVPISSFAEEGDVVGALPISMGSPNGRGRQASGSATISGSTSRGNKRRARLSASVYEPSAAPMSGSPPSLSSSPSKPNGFARPSNGDSNELHFASEADAFRAKMEALRNEVGDSWLKVLSQSNNLSPPTGGAVYSDFLEDLNVRHEQGEGVRCITFSPDGETLASGSDDNTIRCWKVANGLPVGVPLAGHIDAVTSIAYSPDGKTLASGSFDDTIRLWSVETGEPIGKPLRGHTMMVVCIWVSRQHDSTWDSGTGEPIGAPLTGHTESVLSVAFSPDSNILASGSQDTKVRLWDVKKREPIGAPLSDQESPVWFVGFSANGKTLAAGSSRGAVLWDTTTWRSTGKLREDHSNWIHYATLSADKKPGITCVHGDVPSWDPQTCPQCNPSLSIENHPFKATIERVKAVPLIFEGQWITFLSKRLLWFPSSYWNDKRARIVLSQGKLIFVNQVVLSIFDVSRALKL